MSVGVRNRLAAGRLSGSKIDFNRWWKVLCMLVISNERIVIGGEGGEKADV